MNDEAKRRAGEAASVLRAMGATSAPSPESRKAARELLDEAILGLRAYRHPCPKMPSVDAAGFVLAGGEGPYDAVLVVRSGSDGIAVTREHLGQVVAARSVAIVWCGWVKAWLGPDDEPALVTAVRTLAEEIAAFKAAPKTPRAMVAAVVAGTEPVVLEVAVPEVDFSEEPLEWVP